MSQLHNPRSTKVFTCGKCGQPIPVGVKYYWMTRKGVDECRHDSDECRFTEAEMKDTSKRSTPSTTTTPSTTSVKTVTPEVNPLVVWIKKQNPEPKTIDDLLAKLLEAARKSKDPSVLAYVPKLETALGVRKAEKEAEEAAAEARMKEIDEAIEAMDDEEKEALVAQAMARVS